MRTFEEMMPVLTQFSRAMTKYSLIDRKSFDFGVGMQLYPAEIHMVTTVDMHDAAGVTELAEELGTTKGAVSQLVGKLVKKGLLVKEPDPEHGARVIIRTTELGKKASDNHVNFHRNHDRDFLEFMSQLDDDAYETIRQFGEQMNMWMDNYLK
nr:MarR family winged helix-turn-helix transcriptional regulator [uncultured Pseudodesulfovibrio sp.]